MEKYENSWESVYLDHINASDAATTSFIDFRHHANALMWGIGLITFGFIVLAYDTRNTNNPRESTYQIRDHILGLEQRHFLVILNGVLLYFSLAFMTSPS